MVVLPATDLAGARFVAELLMRAVQQLGVGLQQDALPCHAVTVSVGVAAVRPVRGQQAEDLTKVADQALYQAKQAGRNGMVALPVPDGGAGVEGA